LSASNADPSIDRLDELLAIRCQLAEPAALDELVERWHPPLWRYVLRMCGDEEEAADLLQGIWLRILRALPGLRDPGRLRPWLFGIARRAVMDRHRAR
jgi:RNA polymerase sigma factor (sigma-70 family)